MSADDGKSYHQTLQTVANVVSTAAAVAALLYSANTYQNTVHSDSENQAKADWSSYLALAYSDPEFHKGYFSEINVPVMEYLNRDDSRDDRKFAIFVTRMNFYFDNILSSSNDKKWRIFIKRELELHKPRICYERNIIELALEGSVPENIPENKENDRIYSKEFLAMTDELLKDCSKFPVKM